MAVALAALDLPADRGADCRDSFAAFRSRSRWSSSGLVLTGVVGRVTYDAKGFPGRFPPLVDPHFRLRCQRRARVAPLMRCFYQRDDRAHSLAEERKRVAGFFEADRCVTIDDPAKPTILIVGDSHAAHLFAGLTDTYGRTANILTLSSVFCVPLVENVEMDAGRRGDAAVPRHQRLRVRPDPRDQAGHPYGRRLLLPIRPRGELALSRLSRRARRGREVLACDGVRSIIVAGEVPTWAPWMPILVGRDVLETGEAPVFSTVGVRPTRSKPTARSRPRTGAKD